MGKKFTDKQVQILDVAEELIAKKGFDGTSVREISTKAGINVAMISYYFGSKEKMLAGLYQYRVQRARDSFSEFTETIRSGRPEMQMKEIIRFITSQMFRYSYFHGFVRQEIRHTDLLKDELLEFYRMAVDRIDEAVKKGVELGVFRHAPKPEDILITIIGPALFVIRNRAFFIDFLQSPTDEDYLPQAEEKIRANAYQTIFSLLGYFPDA